MLRGWKARSTSNARGHRTQPSDLAPHITATVLLRNPPRDALLKLSGMDAGLIICACGWALLDVSRSGHPYGLYVGGDRCVTLRADPAAGANRGHDSGISATAAP